MSEKTKRHLFASEKLLSRAIVGLLWRLPGVTEVRDLHGSQEYGKDLVFYYKAPLEDETICACVIKNQKITGKAGSSKGVRTIFQQVEEALDTEFIDKCGEARRVHRAYVISPYEIPPATLSAIKGKLSGRLGQVVFLAGSNLFGLFKNYWPDFIADEENFTSLYLGNLVKTLDGQSTVLDYLHSRGRPARREPKRVYVMPSFERRIYGWNYMKPGLRLAGLLRSLKKGPSIFAIIRVIDELAQLDNIIEYLNRYKFRRVDLTPQLRELGELAAALVDLRERIVALQKRKSRDVPSDEDVEVGSREKNRSIEVSSSIAPLMKQVSDVAGQKLEVALAVESLLWPVSVACRQLNESLVNLQSESQGYFTEEVAELCRVADVLASAPPGLVDKTKDRLNFFFGEDLVATWPQPLLIAGPPGSGKTSFCRWNALADAEAATVKESRILPIYVPLHRIKISEIGTFDETFLLSRRTSALLPAVDLDDLYKKWNLRVYLDGLDEIANREAKEKVMTVLELECRKRRNLQIIVTCRDVVIGPWLSWIPRVWLRGLDQEGLESLAKQWLGEETNKASEFQSQLEEAAGLSELLEVPLLATLVILVFRQTGMLPQSRTNLYQMFVDLLSGGWDLVKCVPRTMQFGQVVKQKVMGRIARRIHKEGRREFKEGDFGLAATDILSVRKEEELTSLIEEIVLDGLVLRSGGTFYFKHFSFQEFLAARELLGDPTGREAKEALRLFMWGDDWWREVVRFYASLVESPRRVATWLRSWSHASRSYEERASLVQHWLVEAFPDFEIEKS